MGVYVIAMPFGVAEKTTSHVQSNSLSGFTKLNVDAPAQVRKEIRDRAARFGARGDHLELHLWMQGKQAQQLDTRVADPADYTALIMFIPGSSQIKTTQREGATRYSGWRPSWD